MVNRPVCLLIFSVLHPCFNNGGMSHVVEMVERDGEVTTQYAVKVWRYLTPTTARGLAMIGQPELQLLFHRPLAELLGECFAAGFVLDGLAESAFPAGHESGTLAAPLVSGHWRNPRRCSWPA